MVSLLKILNHLPLRILEALVCLLRVRHTLLHVIETLITWTYRVLIGLESSLAVILALIISLFCLHKVKLLQLSFQVLNKEANLRHY